VTTGQYWFLKLGCDAVCLGLYWKLVKTYDLPAWPTLGIAAVGLLLGASWVLVARREREPRPGE